jgi:NADH:ubiquinone oxidoreductase subunit 6 (subunit J)
MLSNPEGHALYDRLSWEAGLSAATGALLVGLLTWTTASNVFLVKPESVKAGEPAPILLPTTPEAQAANILAPRHVERLGAELFSTHLIAVEAGGTLLLVALVGAIAIVAHGRTPHAPREAGLHAEREEYNLEPRHG